MLDLHEIRSTLFNEGFIQTKPSSTGAIRRAQGKPATIPLAVKTIVLQYISPKARYVIVVTDFEDNRKDFEFHLIALDTHEVFVSFDAMKVWIKDIKDKE